MKKLLIIPFLFLSVVYGQGRYAFSNTVHLSEDEAPEAPTGNLIADTAFATGTPWNFGTDWSLVSNEASYAATSSGFLTQTDEDMNGSIVEDTQLRLLFDVSISGGTANIRIDNAAEDVTYVAQFGYSDGSQEVDFTSPSDISGGGISFRGSSTSTNPFTIDNILLMKRVLGSEMISNGGFDNSNNWTLDVNGSWTIGSGVASYDDIASSQLYQTDANMVSSVETSNEYEVTFDIVSSGTLAIVITNADYSVNYSGSSNYGTGSHTVQITTPASIGVGGFMLRVSSSGSTASGTVDNVSMKKWILE